MLTREQELRVHESTEVAFDVWMHMVARRVLSRHEYRLAEAVQEIFVRHDEEKLRGIASEELTCCIVNRLNQPELNRAALRGLTMLSMLHSQWGWPKALESLCRDLRIPHALERDSAAR
jgi:hypothetical protein